MICCVVLLAGCAAEPDVSATDAEHSDATFDPTDDPFGWTRFEDNERVEIGTFTAPVDYTDPSKGKFQLNIARHLAMKPKERIGSLLVNPGGPGFGGTDFAIFAEQNFGQPLLDHFDIVAWDPRGTGESEPKIDCIDDYDEFFAAGDITPEDPPERQQLIDLADEFTTDCVEKNAAYYQYVGTNNSARDIDAIRAALGEATISYLGFSYGSELGGTWATMFPTTVRAAVFDGAVDPNADATESELQQVKGFDAALDRFLAACSANKDCPFQNDGDAAGAFDRLMQAIDESPVPTEASRPPVNQAMAVTAVAQALYSEASWPQLARALAETQDGDGSGLLALYDRYYVRHSDGSWANSLEAFQVISCMDTAQRPAVEEEDANAVTLHAAAPRFVIRTVGDYSCTFFPPASDPRIAITGEGAGPILVMGTTGDPATPLESTRRMAETLEQGRLVIVTGNRHTGYGLNECSSAAVENYLVDPVGQLPPDGLRCE
jgi:pimeloyl-ACP methyl ester carboxylesterase